MNEQNKIFWPALGEMWRNGSKGVTRIVVGVDLKNHVTYQIIQEPHTGSCVFEREPGTFGMPGKAWREWTRTATFIGTGHIGVKGQE